MHHVALDRPRPHDRHLDDEIVEARAASGAAAWSSAPGSRPGTRRRNRRGTACRRPSGSSAGTVASVELARRCAGAMRSKARRMQVSMPSASTSTFSMPSASRSSLSHSMTVRSSIAAFSIGTSSSSGPRVMTKPPTCCDRWRGKPISSCARSSARRSVGSAGSRPTSRTCALLDRRRVPQPHTVPASAAVTSSRQAQRLADLADRARAGDSRSRWRRARRGRGRICRRCTGSPPRAAHARNRRRCRAARCARR